MLEAWLNFGIIIFVQFLFFITQAFYMKKLSEVLGILRQGALVGIIMGILFDLILGKFFGLHSYTLGFGVFFLIINSILSYGLFASSVLLMRHFRLQHLLFCIIILVAFYEITNHFFRVWTWEFVLPRFEFFAVLLIGYFLGTIFVAINSQVFFKHRFLFIDNLLKK